MKPKEFHITIYSTSRGIITFATTACTLFLLIDHLPWSKNEIIIVITFLAILSSSFYLANLLGRAKAKIIFTQEAFLHIWEKKFILSSETDIKIPWELVDNYVFEKDRNVDSFIINLTNNKRYKINRINYLPIEDDFYDLVKKFPHLANRYKNQNISENEVKEITKGKSFYATKEFKWIFYVMVVGFIFIVISSLASNSKPNWYNLGVIASGLLFYGTMIARRK